jgi:hypothetical protein
MLISKVQICLSDKMLPKRKIKFYLSFFAYFTESYCNFSAEILRVEKIQIAAGVIQKRVSKASSTHINESPKQLRLTIFGIFLHEDSQRFFRNLFQG